MAPVQCRAASRRCSPSGPKPHSPDWPAHRRSDRSPNLNSAWPFGRSMLPISARWAAGQDSSGVWIHQNFWAMSFRYHSRIVSGLATRATSARALRPSRLPISAKADRIRQPQSRRQMGSQNAILCHQILVLEQQLLIDQASDVRQQSYPFVFFHLDRP